MQEVPSAKDILALVNDIAMDEIARADDPFYNGRLRSGECLAWYNKMLLDLVPKLQAQGQIVEIGGGNGILPICLALQGANTVCIDHFEPRVAIGRAILARLERDQPGLSGRVQLISGAFPQDLPPVAAGSLAITTNFAGTHAGEVMDPGAIAPFVQAMGSRFDAWLFDICLFWGTWREPESWGKMLALVEEVAGQKAELLYAHREDYARYYILRFGDGERE